MSIRKAEYRDLKQILPIYAYAREQMALNGNPSQWGTDKPEPETIRQDIAKGRLFLIEADLPANSPGQDVSIQQITGVFAFQMGEEPTYRTIQGKWLNDLPYGVIHRIAGTGRQKGILAQCLEFCDAFTENIRIDTHENNLIMRHLLEKNGFSECGIIHVEDKSPRIAFQRLNLCAKGQSGIDLRLQR